MQKSTQIKFYEDNVFPTNTSGGTLDLDANTQIPLNFAISDIRDISKKKGTFSKSIVIPGTKNNHQLLNNYFDVNIQKGSFNINKVQRCYIIQNGIVILDNAIAQLVSINKTQNNGSYEENVTYTLLIKDSTSDFFTNISNNYLNDLDLSDLDHVYTAANVISSFNNTITDGYKYVMPFNSENPLTLIADAEFDLNEFCPGIYAKKYFDKIFAKAGYSYEWLSAEDDDVNFSKLIIPYNGDVVTNDFEDSTTYLASASKSSTESYTSKPLGTVQMYTSDTKPAIVAALGTNGVMCTTEINDPNGNYVNSVGSGNFSPYYVMPIITDMAYNVRIEYECEYDVQVINTSGSTKYFIGKWNDVTGQPSAGYVYPSILGSYEVLPKINIIKANNGIAIPQSNSTVLDSNILTKQARVLISNGQSFPAGTTSIGSATIQTHKFTLDDAVQTTGLTLGTQLGFQSVDLDNVAYLDQSKKVWNFYSTSTPTIKYGTGSTTPATGISIVYKLKSTTVRYVCELLGEFSISYNMNLSMNKFVPQNIKQSDFVKSILTMFNVYVEQDKSVPNKLNLYKRNEYYDSGLVKDWTRKLVKDKAQDLKFLPELTTKKLLLSYKQDEDIANSNYFASTKEIYGQAEYTFANEYVKDRTPIELIFSPTPVSVTSFDAVCPIWNGQAPSCNIRILYDGGSLSCGNYQIVQTRTLEGVAGNIVNGNTYPHISHWDKPINPTFDLNFLPCDYYYRHDDWGSNTNNNLFNLHWRRTLNQIDNGKMLTAYFNLNATDINTLKLNDKIRIDNSWWNINAIKDYDANASGPTKVELISIDDYLSIPFIEKSSSKLQATSPKLHVLNDLSKINQRFKNQIYSTGNIQVVGTGNIITSGTNGLVIGTGNSVNTIQASVIGNGNIVEGSTSIVYGNNNIVNSNLDNVTIVGSGITASESDALHTNAIIIPDGGTINNVPITNVVGLWAAGTGTESVIQINSTAPNQATGDNAIAIGRNTQASGNDSFASGQSSISSGLGSHAEGGQSLAQGTYAHSEGYLTEANGEYSHAEGISSKANGDQSHAEGNSIASGEYGHSQGYLTKAAGFASHAGGDSNEARTYAETVVGTNATIINGNATSYAVADPAFRVGNGPNSGSPSDAFRVYKNGAAYLKPITPGSITSPVVGMIAFDSSTNDLKIYNGTAWVTVGSTGNMTQQLIIRMTGASTFSVIKDDLSIGGSTSVTFTTTGLTPFIRTAAITFPGSVNADNVIAEFENDSWFNGDAGSGSRSSSGSTLTLNSGGWVTASSQLPAIVGTVIILNIY